MISRHISQWCGKPNAINHPQNHNLYGWSEPFNPLTSTEAILKLGKVHMWTSAWRLAERVSPLSSRHLDALRIDLRQDLQQQMEDSTKDSTNQQWPTTDPSLSLTLTSGIFPWKLVVALWLLHTYMVYSYIPRVLQKGLLFFDVLCPPKGPSWSPSSPVWGLPQGHQPRWCRSLERLGQDGPTIAKLTSNLLH